MMKYAEIKDPTSPTVPISNLYSLCIFFFIINSIAFPMNIFWSSNNNDNKKELSFLKIK